MKSSLESKTVRPGLLAYSSYHSDRHPLGGQLPEAEPKRAGHKLAGLLFLAAVLAGIIFGFNSIVHQQSNNVDPKAKTTNSAKAIITKTPASSTSAVAAATQPNQCAGNTLSQFILVSISQRHMWACQSSKTVYDSPVVTGIEYLAADKTPTGTYHIYGKETDVTLTGSDSTGSWSDPVNYWMPFLNNQYGTYGFHDATWRPDSAFGNIDPNSAQASHGCVELPLATAKWLFNWAQVGTTLTIQS